MEFPCFASARCWDHDEIVVEQVNKRLAVRGDDPAGEELAKRGSAWPACFRRARRSRISASTGGPVCRPISCCPVLDGDVVFVPGEVPRQGVFAFWGAGPGPDKVELVFPGGTY